MARDAKFQSNSSGRLDRNLDFLSFCFVSAPGPYTVLPYHHPKLFSKAAWKLGKYCPLQSLKFLQPAALPPFPDQAGSEENTWIGSLSGQVFPKSGRSKKEEMGMALSSEEERFWQGSHKCMVFSVLIRLGKGSCRRESSRPGCIIAMETAKELVGRI